MLKSRPLMTRFTALVLLPCAAFAVYTWRNLRASLPEDSGSLIVAGISAPVQIRRDAHGIPFIEAKTDNDAFFAAGYVHAQDRLWQLELQRRVVDGRLSEIFGKDSIQQDIWMRTLGIRDAARASWETLSPEGKASLTAYTAGVNAYLAQGHKLPPEFLVLGLEPQPWTVYDSLGWNYMFALTLGGNFREEINRFVASQYLSTDKLHALFDGYPAETPLTVTAAEQAQAQKLMQVAELQQQLESDLKLGGRYAGSNGWVVSGKLTNDSQPIVANDPHLAVQVPSLWYGIRLKGDRIDVSGMSLVGLPVVIFGRNDHVAWGGTNMMADQQDLYFERVNPENPTEYEVNGRWEKFTTRTEQISVRNESPAFLRGALRPISIEVRGTRHGPVISDQFEGFDQPVALRWNVLERKGGASYESFRRANYARDWQSFNAAFSDYVAPALNLLYGDTQGNIGYVGIGSVPVRSKGEGTLPVPGWNDDYTWTGAIPFEQMPRSFNPPKGYIVNANNRVTAPGYPWFISHDWAPATRATRIEQLLQQKIAAGQRLSVADMQAIQGDVANAPSAALAKVMTRVIPQNEMQREAVRALSRWDGSMDRQSVGASIFVAWSDGLRRRIFADELEGPWNRRGKTRQLEPLTSRMQDGELAALLENDRLKWCDDVRTPEVETCHQALMLSLETSLKDLKKMHGSDVSEWTWGSVHRTQYAHTPFSQTNLLRPLFQREVANGGSSNSVNVAAASFRGTEGYVQTFGAGFRQIMSMGPHGSRHFYMNSTGQSGNVMSRHYDDMVVPFRDVAYYTLDHQSPAATQPLTLTPR